LLASATQATYERALPPTRRPAFVPVAQLDRATRPFTDFRLSRTPPPRLSSNFFRPFSARIALNPPQFARADGHLVRGRSLVFQVLPNHPEIFNRVTFPGYFSPTPLRAALVRYRRLLAAQSARLAQRRAVHVLVHNRLALKSDSRDIVRALPPTRRPAFVPVAQLGRAAVF
jgi:hypothetical protein